MIDLVLRHVIPATFSLLPAKMDSTPAVAMLLAIGLQETRFLERRQRDNGPARSFWQFEPGAQSGFALLFGHTATRTVAVEVCRMLRYPHTHDLDGLRRASEHNDVLACAMARLLLWTLPRPLPLDDTEDAEAWQQYLDAWRPGRPRPETWASCYREAWARVLVSRAEVLTTIPPAATLPSGGRDGGTSDQDSLGPRRVEQPGGTRLRPTEPDPRR